METMHAAGRRRLPPVPRSADSLATTGPLAVEATTDESWDIEQCEPLVLDPRELAAELVRAETTDVESAGDVTERLLLSEIAAAVAAAEAGEAVGEPDHVEGGAVVVGAVATSAIPAPRETTEPQTAEPPTPEPPTAAPDTAEPQTPVAEPRHFVPSRVPALPDPGQEFVARLRSSAEDFAAAAGAASAVVREAVPPARHRRARCRVVLRYIDGRVVDVTLLGPTGAPGSPSRHGFDRQMLRWFGRGLVQHDEWLVDDADAPDGVAVDLTAWVASHS